MRKVYILPNLFTAGSLLAGMLAIFEVFNDNPRQACWLIAISAILDVFEEEPLPPHDPLWQLPNILITPHNSAWSHPDQVARIFERNYLRFLEQAPLEFMVDFQRGY